MRPKVLFHHQLNKTKKRRPRRRRPRAPELTVKQILAWADEWHERTGTWPKKTSGHIPGSLDETWAKVNSALYFGTRGLPGRSSLARLLEEERGVRNKSHLPPLPASTILAWADKHHQRTGKWPTHESGPVDDAPGENWLAVDMALRKGHRDLPSGSSLARLIENERGARNHLQMPRLRVSTILAWADKHHERTGEWPANQSGPIRDTPDETWLGVDMALRKGHRGLPGGSSLARLFEKKRGVRNICNLMPFTEKQILAWADTWHRRTGKWPSQYSGTIPGSDSETWQKVNAALRVGVRGLPGGSSLAVLLEGSAAFADGQFNRLAEDCLEIGPRSFWGFSIPRRSRTPLAPTPAPEPPP